MLLRSLSALFLSCFTSLILAVSFLCYAHYVEPYWVEETHEQLVVEHWQGRPLRLAVIADLHAKANDGPYMDSIVKRTLEAKPDVVLLLGDYINEGRLGDSMDTETLGKHLAPLAQLPCYAVLGNHDYEYGAQPVRAMLQGLGAKVLEGRMEALEVGRDTLYLGGIRCLSWFDTPGRVPQLPREAANATCLILTHSPAAAHYVPQGTTATFCGHTHAGQVCLPGGIPLVRPDARVRWEEMKDPLTVAGKPVFISRGLGTSVIPLRFCCRPELVFVELRGKQGKR